MALGYTFSAVFSMLLVILTGTRYYKNDIKEFADKEFILLTKYIAVYCAVDALWGMFYFGHLVSKTGFEIVCYSVYSLSAITTFCWFDYIIKNLETGINSYYLLKAASAILVGLQLLILVSNVFTHSVFYVNSLGVYHGFFGRTQLQSLQSFNYLLIFLYVCYRLIKGKYQNKRNLFRILLYSILPGLFGAGQIVLIDASMYSFGFALTVFVIFMYERSIEIMNTVYRHSKEERDEQLAIIRGIAGDFSTIYSINMETGGFIVYNKIKDENFLSKADNSKLDYFKTAVEKGRKMIHEDDLEKFLLVMEKDIILRRFERESSFSLILRIKFGSVIKYIEYRFADNSTKDKKRALIGVYDIDKAYRKKLKDNELLKTAKARQTELEEEAKVLEKAALRDIMTGLYNRRAFEDYVAECKGMPDGKDFVYVSLDVNGLKAVNDDLGHDAGDELIRGSAFCMKKALGDYGYIYRHGGDEFSAILHAPEDKLPEIFSRFDKELDAFKGKLVDEISVSYGYVTVAETGEISIEEMSKIADKRMYEAKNLHYSRKGIDRRGQQEAYDAIRKSYLKVLKVDIRSDSFSNVYMDESETESNKGFDSRISKWIQNFADSDNVHPDDVKHFKESLSMSEIKDHFANGRDDMAIHYRRKTANGEYSNALLEIIPSENFSEDNQIVFLYVKNIH